MNNQGDEKTSMQGSRNRQLDHTREHNKEPDDQTLTGKKRSCISTRALEKMKNWGKVYMCGRKSLRTSGG